MSDCTVHKSLLKLAAAFATVALAACDTERPSLPSDIFKIDPASTREVGLLLNKKGDPICNIAVLASDVVVTDKHCIDGGGVTVSVLQKDGRYATSPFTILLEGSRPWVDTVSRNTPQIFANDHAEIAIDQAILKLEKPIGDKDALAKVTDPASLTWTQLDDTNLQVTDIKMTAYDVGAKGTKKALLSFDCKLVRSPLLDIVVSTNCPMKGGSSGGSLHARGPKGEFLLVALARGFNSFVVPENAANPVNMVGFEFLPVLKMDNFSLELFDITDGKKFPERAARTAVLVAPLAEECRKSKAGCNIP